jgi:hypothetical protein
MTSKYQIISWRDIPAQVKVKAGRQRAGKPLSQRFTASIDEAAMRAGKTESDDYMAEWRTSDWQEREGNLEEIADALVSELEAAYPNERLRLLVEQHGLEKQGG